MQMDDGSVWNGQTWKKNALDIDSKLFNINFIIIFAWREGEEVLLLLEWIVDKATSRDRDFMHIHTTLFVLFAVTACAQRDSISRFCSSFVVFVVVVVVCLLRRCHPFHSALHCVICISGMSPIEINQLIKHCISAIDDVFKLKMHTHTMHPWGHKPYPCWTPHKTATALLFISTALVNNYFACIKATIRGIGLRSRSCEWENITRITIGIYPDACYIVTYIMKIATQRIQTLHKKIMWKRHERGANEWRIQKRER